MSDLVIVESPTKAKTLTKILSGTKVLSTKGHIMELSKDYPITPKEHGTEFLMSNRHLWLRSKRQHSILKIRHQIRFNKLQHFWTLSLSLGYQEKCPKFFLKIKMAKHRDFNHIVY